MGDGYIHINTYICRSVSVFLGHVHQSVVAFITYRFSFLYLFRTFAWQYWVMGSYSVSLIIYISWSALVCAVLSIWQWHNLIRFLPKPEFSAVPNIQLIRNRFYEILIDLGSYFIYWFMLGKCLSSGFEIICFAKIIDLLNISFSGSDNKNDKFTGSLRWEAKQQSILCRRISSWWLASGHLKWRLG